ncbi:hypothetical protein MMC31_001130 [Peltigera leucophlebia]|nr:hypothetical protein [Peltigera leucophlebia]
MASQHSRLQPVRKDNDPPEIPLFSGHNYEPEDPERFLEKLKASREMGYDLDSADDSENLLAINLFRNHLKSDAFQWYSSLDLATRHDWPKLENEFKAYFRHDPRDKPTALCSKQNFGKDGLAPVILSSGTHYGFSEDGNKATEEPILAKTSQGLIIPGRPQNPFQAPLPTVFEEANTAYQEASDEGSDTGTDCLDSPRLLT